MRSDIYALGVITYQMLTGRLPCGPGAARARSRRDINRLTYPSAIAFNEDVPLWVDAALRKALHPNPSQRYAEVAEFVYDLRHPRGNLVADHELPLIERDPNRFWKGLWSCSAWWWSGCSCISAASYRPTALDGRHPIQSDSIPSRPRPMRGFVVDRAARTGDQPSAGR